MENKKKAGSKIPEVAGRIFDLLEPLTSEERHKVINSTLILLGETPTSPTPGTQGPSTKPTGDGSKADQNLGGLPERAKAWMKQNQLNLAQVERVFHIAHDGATVIASPVPGKGAREQTHNAYVLQGISRLLAAGDPSFTDKDARKVCQNLGCYSPTNHATYLSDKGNLLTGSKDKGWNVTAPGLKHGADLVKELTKEA
jgi:hypothetical protein